MVCYDLSKKSDIKEPIAGNLAQKSALLLKLGFCDQRETQGNRQNDKGVHSIGRVASEIVFQPGGHVSGRVASKTAFQKAGENCVGARSTERVLGSSFIPTRTDPNMRGDSRDRWHELRLGV